MRDATAQALIGAVVFNGNKAMAQCVQAGVRPEWFSGQHKTILARAFDLFAQGKPIDTISIVPYGDACAGDIMRWTSEAPPLAHLNHHINIARQEHVLAMANVMLLETQDALANCASDDVDEQLGMLQSKWASLGVTGTQQLPFAEVVGNLIEEWQQPKTAEEINSIFWPLRMLQHHIGPLDDEYVILGSLPSVGKTALIVQWASMLAKAMIPNATASLESSAKKLAMRAISFVGEVNTIRLRRKDGTPDDMERAKAAWQKIKGWPMSVADNGMTSEQLRAWGMAEKAKGARILFVDNSKHIRSSQRFDTPVLQFRHLSLQCKFLRDDLRIPVVLLHHLNQDMNLSWSSDIERDADIIITMAKNEDYSIEATQDNGWTEKAIVDYTIKKNRDGPRELTVMSEFKKDIQCFRSYDPSAAPVDFDEIATDAEEWAPPE